jgi:hypothetical protein
MPPKKLLLASTVLIVLITFPLIGSVGASSEMWSQTYGGEYGNIVYSFDRASSVVETSDGGYALVGTRHYFGSILDSWLVKTDESGNVEWNQTYGEGLASSLVATSDGGFALAGNTKSFGAGGDDFWLVKTDAYGNVEWNQTYGGTDNDHANSLIETIDGGYALAGYTESFGAGSRVSWLVKIDGYGNVEWNQTYLEMSAGPLVQTTDGGFVLAGEDGMIFQDFWLVRTDANGNHVWNCTFGGDCVDFVHSLVETSDGGFALGCTFGSLMEPDLFWLIKTDVECNVEWSHTYEEGKTSSLVETSDGGFALAGSRGDDFCLIKTDEYGNMKWNRTYGGNAEDYASSLVECCDGGYVIAGYTFSFDVRACDYLLIKTDEYGIVPEFSLWFIMPLFITTTLLILICKQRLTKTSSNGLDGCKPRLTVSEVRRRLALSEGQKFLVL